LAERGEFELPVPLSEQSDYNRMSGFTAPRRIRDRPNLKRQGGLYGRQHPNGTFPSCANIAMDVAAVIQ
jgi:hypothetical protein